MQSLLYVFLGGGLGSMCRYGVGQWLRQSSSGFPMATFVVNVLACLVLGAILALELKSSLKLSHKLLFATGFCGGFSTFSTFSAEILRLFQDGNVGLGLTYVGVSLVAGLVAVYIGYRFIQVF